MAMHKLVLIEKMDIQKVQDVELSVSALSGMWVQIPTWVMTILSMSKMAMLHMTKVHMLQKADLHMARKGMLHIPRLDMLKLLVLVMPDSGMLKMARLPRAR